MLAVNNFTLFCFFQCPPCFNYTNDKLYFSVQFIICTINFMRSSNNLFERWLCSYVTYVNGFSKKEFKDTTVFLVTSCIDISVLYFKGEKRSPPPYIYVHDIMLGNKENTVKIHIHKQYKFTKDKSCIVIHHNFSQNFRQKLTYCIYYIIMLKNNIISLQM